MNPRDVIDPIVSPIVDRWSRQLREVAVGCHIDSDGGLDELWRVLRQKRGNRRGGPR